MKNEIELSSFSALDDSIKNGFADKSKSNIYLIAQPIIDFVKIPTNAGLDLLLNFNGLDESVTKQYSNVVGEIAVAVGKLGEAGGKTVQAKASMAKTESEVGCVKPSMFALKKKKQAYQQCLNEYSKRKQSDKGLDRELELQKLKNTTTEKQLQFKQKQMQNTTNTKTYRNIAIAGALILGISAIGFAIAYYRK